MIILNNILTDYFCINMSNENVNNIYHLKTADGQVWSFIATKGTNKIVAMAASIMGLKQGFVPGIKRIFYVANDIGKVKIAVSPPIGYDQELDSLPANGWKALKSGDINIWVHRELPDIICEIGDTVMETVNLTFLILSLYPLYNQVILSGGLPFHTALLEYRGKGILISAKSGVGKSTCCRRVIPPWQAICDDQVLIVQTDGGYRVHPYPTWSEYYEDKQKTPIDVNQHFPLSGIFFLEQSLTEGVEPISAGRAAQSIYETSKSMFHRYSIYPDQTEKRNLYTALFENACAISNEVPSYVLRASINGRFCEEIEKVLDQ